ncbi:hypothetical protein M426DRAFT_7742 [Hypoxylon sp. CI-4A]|nr:hypothetical protein M426DRAFT_7742 [Hypoxylon sp. CI-4A]
MASTSSALNLSQFQFITSNQIPKKCIRAYQSDIEGCTLIDFTNGSQCSSSCVEGLEETQEHVQKACGDLNVTPNSLLGLVLSGDLVDTLCPGFQATTVTETIQPSSTKGGFSTIVPAPTTTSVETSKTSSTTSQKTTSTSESSSSSTTSTTIQSTTAQETSSSSSTSSEQSTSSSSSSSADVTATQSSAQSTTATSQPAQSATPDDSQGDDDTTTPFIGGSPFDPSPIQDSGTTGYLGFRTEVLMAATIAVFFVL